MMKMLKLFVVFVLLLGLTAPAMAEETKPATKIEAEKGHVHKEGDGHKNDKKDTKDHDHKDGDGHDHDEKKPH